MGLKVTFQCPRCGGKVTGLLGLWPKGNAPVDVAGTPTLPMGIVVTRDPQPVSAVYIECIRCGKELNLVEK